MPTSTIIDFDGTLVAENSTRVLEEVIFSEFFGHRRKVVGWLFFGGGKRAINAVVVVLLRVTRRQIDWRFALFLSFLGDTSSMDTDRVVAATTKCLTVNHDLLAALEDVPEIAIISCGMTPVIRSLCEGLPRSTTLLAASSFSLDRDARRRTMLLEPSDKVSFLLRRPNEPYITDDGDEARLVAAKMEGATGTTFHVSRRYGFYVVTGE